MKHLLHSSIAFFLGVLALSCTSRELTPSVPEETGQMVICAAVESIPVKTSVDENGKLYWSKSDCLSVLTSSSNSRFTTSIQNSAAVAEFNGTAPSSNSYLGLYPYSADALSDGASISTTLPSAQQGIPGSFADDLFISVAQAAAPTGMDFKNVCSGLRFKLSSAGISSVSFKANGGEALAGTATIAFGQDGIPYVSKVAQPSSEISLSPAEGDEFIADQWYYIVTLPATLSQGFTLSFVKDGAPYSVSTGSEIVLQRSHFGSLDGADAKAVLQKTADAGLYWEEEGFKNTVTVIYDGAGATVTSSNKNIKYGISGANVWVNLGDDATGKKAEIIVSGSSTDGSLKIYGEKKYKLTLNGVNLTSASGPAINAQNGKRMYLHLTQGTQNFLADSATYSDDFYYVDGASSETEQRKACLFAEGRIIVSGTGSLNVTGRHGSAITTDDFFYMRPGPQITIPSSADHGLKIGGIATPDTDDYDADGDLIGCTITGGSLTIAVSQAGAKAINCESDVKVTGGSLNLKSTANATIVTSAGVTDTLATACVKADGNFKMTGGKLTCLSTGTAGKGLNVDGNIIIGNTVGGRPVIDISTTGGQLGTSSDQPGGPGGGGFPGGGKPGGGFGGGGGGSSSNASYSKAIRAEGTITVYDCDMTIYTAGSGAEGMESKSAERTAISLLGGRMKMYCYDDCINASAGGILFGGAEVFTWSTGNDSIDSNYKGSGAISVTGGFVMATSSAGGLEEGFDSDDSALIISGGYVFTMGRSQGSTPSVPTQSTAIQCSALMTGLSLTAGNYLSVFDNSGNTLFSVRIPFSFSSCYSVITCPDFVSGGKYTVKTGTAAPSSCLDAWRCTNSSPSYEVGFYYHGSSSASYTLKTLSFTSKYIRV